MHEDDICYIFATEIKKYLSLRAMKNHHMKPMVLASLEKNHKKLKQPI